MSNKKKAAQKVKENMPNKKKIAQDLVKIREIQNFFKNNNHRLNFIAEQLKKELKKKTANIAKSQINKWRQEIATIHKSMLSIDRKIGAIHREMKRAIFSPIKLSQQRFKESIGLVNTSRLSQESKKQHITLLETLSNNIEELQKSKEKLSPKKVNLLLKAANHTKDMYLKLNKLEVRKSFHRSNILIEPPKKLKKLGFKSDVMKKGEDGAKMIQSQLESFSKYWCSFWFKKFKVTVRGIASNRKVFITHDTGNGCNCSTEEMHPHSTATLTTQRRSTRRIFDKDKAWSWCLYENKELVSKGELEFNFDTDCKEIIFTIKDNKLDRDQYLNVRDKVESKTILF